jgi:twitching motility protein PilT
MPSPLLNELEFVDLYVCLEGDAAPHYHKDACAALETAEIDIPDVYLEPVDRLTAYLREKFTDIEMGLTFENVRMRAAKIKTASGLVWAVMRKINAVPPPVEKLGFLPALVPHLKNIGKRDGLVVLCGATGQGKTTTCCSLLADYLNNLGGVAFSIEDPVEFDLEGRHGKSGYCYQSEISNDDEWAEMLKRSLRWHPRYIYVGEIRTPDAANQLLRAATSGHLVMTTIHSGTIEEALEGILQLAEQAVGDRATSLLATGLTAIFHQTLTPLGLKANFFITEPHGSSSAFRACIRDKRIASARTFVDQQAALLMQSGKIFRDGKDG